MKAIYDDVNYVLNEGGDVNVNEYIKQAHRLRSEAFRSYASSIINAVKTNVGRTFTLPHNPKTA